MVMQKFERAHFEVKNTVIQNITVSLYLNLWKEGLDILLGMH